MNVKNDICRKFLLNPTVNPISNKEIDVQTFKKLVKLCDELNYDIEVNELLDSLIMDQKIGLTGHKDIEQMILLSYDLDTVIKLLRSDPRLRKLVYDLMPIIIQNYKYNQDHHNIIGFIDNLIEMKEFTLIKRLIIELEKNTDLILNYDLDDIIELVKLSKISNELHNLLLTLIPDIVIKYIESFELTDEIQYIEWGINDFIKKLLYLYEEKFAKIAMEKFINILDDDETYYLISQDIFTYDENFGTHVIEEYIKMLPDNFDTQRVYRGVGQTIYSDSSNLKDDQDELIKYIKSILTAAVNLKNRDLLDVMDDILHYELDIESYDILNELIKKAEIEINL